MDTARERALRVLAGFPEPAAPAVALARRLLEAADVTVTRSARAVAGYRLQAINGLRARRPGAAPLVAAQCAALEAVAARFPDEAWHIYRVSAGGRHVELYATADDVGRATFCVTGER